MTIIVGSPCARCKGIGSENTDTEYRHCQMCGGTGDAVPCGKFYSPMVGRCGLPSVDWDDESPRCEPHLKGK